MLHDLLRRLKVWLLECCLISNHVHLLIEAEDGLQVSARINNLVEEFARSC